MLNYGKYSGKTVQACWTVDWASHYMKKADIYLSFKKCNNIILTLNINSLQ